MAQYFKGNIRKRLLRWSIYGLPLVFFVAFYVWYTHSFPLPEGKPKSEVVNRWVVEPVESLRWRLLYWKVQHHTKHLKLEGTAWEDSDTGLVVKFGADGRTSCEVDLAKAKASVELACVVLDGGVYDFDPYKPVRSSQNFGFWAENLRFKNPLGSHGYAVYDGRQLQVDLVLIFDDRTGAFCGDDSGLFCRLSLKKL